MAQKFVVILAGGKGERFWPLSRLRRPKQLLPIVGNRSMLAQTVARVLPLVPAENVYILTNVEQAAEVRKACPELPKGNIIAEPVGRDSGPAVGLAAEIVAARDPKGIFASLHSDAAIHDEKAFQKDLRVAFSAAAAAPVMVTIGVKPHEPSTGYGYIQRGKSWRKVRGVTVSKARRFVEKPAADVAERYLEAGDYYWNTGIFIWSARVVQDAFKRNAPELHAGLARLGAALRAGQNLPRTLRAIYPSLPKIAVDYALLEKADNVVMLPASFDWDDVGSWTAIARHHAHDAKQNTIVGDGLVEEGSGNIVFSEAGHVTAVFGADDLVVVHTSDATLVCPRSKAQEIKSLLNRLKSDVRGQRLL
ncbi:mannose-1-phosphate guanylyltransferase [Horticoccus luteus]|uniref:Mannose-1-phosphate guanylyltransferase n=1 Tax=Horticoccus luteus TaxID=2862869 RepID=A0A8F9TYL2_9BACT|nr:mannose-1-phosphate guanylyltransferase [Horticoccus luteus]QYM80391.1 mannose-1-phosphate guanylyltransferase [Horticoccus luteus]